MRFNSMLVGFGMALGVLFAAPAAMAQAEQDFTLVNATGYQIDEVYVASPASKSWGKDILGDGVLANGASRLIKFRSGTTRCEWDIQVKYDDGTVVEWDGSFDLCKLEKITLRYNRATGVTSAVRE